MLRLITTLSSGRCWMLGRGNPCKIGLFLLTFVSPLFSSFSARFRRIIRSSVRNGKRNYSIPSRRKEKKKEREEIRNVNHREVGEMARKTNTIEIAWYISWGWSLKFMINCAFPEYQRSSFDVARLRRKFSPFRDHGGDLLARGMSALGLL